jgi:diadenosine tetraphosphate (Ap4A) HIT family hydrolase
MTKINCIFCTIQPEKIILENQFSYVIFDGFPVTPLHSLIVPKRHVVDFFGLTKDELSACYELLQQTRSNLMGDDERINGFNVGMNAGASAGQTIFHCHIHLIPRRTGDIEDPRGGVRHLIPGKGFYKD